MSTQTDPLSFLGGTFGFQDDQETIRRNLQLIIRIRWFVSPSIFLIMFLSGLAGLSTQEAFSENQLIVNGINVAIILLFNLVYSVLVRKVKDLGPLVIFQLLIDIVHFTLTVYKTGTITSPFSFLYFFVIFSGALLVSGNTAFLTAGVSAGLYAAVVGLEQAGVLPGQSYFSPLAGLEENASYFILSVAFTVGSMFAFAGLASFLTGLIHARRRELQKANMVLRRKNQTMVLLYRTSEALNRHKTVSEVAGLILRELMDHLGLDRSLLYLNMDNAVLKLFLVEQREGGKAPPTVEIPLKSEAGLTARAAVEQKAYNIADPEHSDYINKELARQIGLNPFAVAPLVLRHRTVGVIGIDRSFAPISNEEFQTLQLFANQAAIAIDSVRRIDPSFEEEAGV